MCSTRQYMVAAYSVSCSRLGGGNKAAQGRKWSEHTLVRRSLQAAIPFAQCTSPALRNAS